MEKKCKMTTKKNLPLNFDLVLFCTFQMQVFKNNDNNEEKSSNKNSICNYFLHLALMLKVSELLN